MLSLHPVLRTFVLWFLTIVGLAAAEFENPHTRWAVQTDGPVRGEAVVSGDEIFFGSSDGFLYAADKSDGDVLWKFQTGGAIAGAPAVTDSFVIVAGRGAHVYALNRADGSERWSFEMQPTLKTLTGWNYFTAAPVVDGDQVLIGSGDGHLYSLDLATGRERWKFETGDSIRATPLVEGDTIYAPSGDDHVYVLSATDGSLQWKFATAGVGYDLSQGFIRSDIYTRPIIAEGLLVFGARDGNVYAVDLATQQTKWTFAYGTTWAMSTAVDGGTVFVGWSTNNKINALDLMTGELIWEFDAPAHTYTTALVIGDTVYWGCADGNLYGFNKSTGEQTWSYHVGTEVYSSITLDEAAFYVGNDDGRLIAINSGAPRARKAVYLPEGIPDGISGFIVDAGLTPYLTARGFELINSRASLGEWVRARTEDGVPSAVVFAFAQVPADLLGESPASGPMRAYLASGGKVVWPWGILNKFTFDEEGGFVKVDMTSGPQLLDIEYISFEDSGNYFSRTTQSGRNWGLPPDTKSSFAVLTPDSYDQVTPLTFDEYGRVSGFVKSFHPRGGSGWVQFNPSGFGVSMTDDDLALIEALASYTLD